MLKILHLGSASLLLIYHCTFLFRALKIIRKGLKPKKLDRLARNLSQMMLPVSVITGLFFLVHRGYSFSLHPSMGILPLVAIPLVFTGRILLKKIRELPWLLPMINLTLIISAVLTGFYEK